MSEITQLLSEIGAGDETGRDKLFSIVYDELRRMAAAKMANERNDHTLQTTALVNEAFLRLVGGEKEQQWNSRGHFFSAAAEAMRRILVDHARDKNRLKRGGGAQVLSLHDIEQIWNPENGDILDLHEALKKFEEEAPREAELVKLTCFAGQTLSEAAALMSISKSTANRYWAFARAWLFDALN